MQSNAAPGGAGAGADRGDAGDREAGLRHTGGGQRGLIDEGPLLRLKRTSIIGSLMAAFDPESGSHSQAVVQSGSPRFARAKVVRFLRMAYIPNSQHERECLYDDGRL